MENQKIINLLDKIDTDSKHFATKKWYVINDENNTNYGVNKDTGANNPDRLAFKNCAPFTKCNLIMMNILMKLMMNILIQQKI